MRFLSWTACWSDTLTPNLPDGPNRALNGAASRATSRALPSSVRWTPLRVSGDLASAKAAQVGAYRSTNGTPASAATACMESLYSLSRVFCPLPSGRFGDLWSSTAVGPNSTSRGADVPLYFWASVCLTNACKSALNCGNPASPAHASLLPKNAKITSALVPTPSKRLAFTSDLGDRSFGDGHGLLPLSHSSGVPKLMLRSRFFGSSSSPLKPRLRTVSLWSGKRACR